MFDAKSLAKRADQVRIEPIPKISKIKRVRHRSPLRAEDILSMKCEGSKSGSTIGSGKDAAGSEQKKKLMSKRVKRESRLKPLFVHNKMEHAKVLTGSEAPLIDDLRKWFPNVKEAEWIRLKALEAHGRRGRTPIDKAYDVSRSAERLAERQVFGKLRSSDDPVEATVMVGQKCAPVEEGVEEGVSPAVTVFRRPVRSQVGSQVENDGTLGLEDEARGAHPESFEMLSKAKTEFAHPTPMPGTESWIDELRMLTKRSYDHRGDRGEGNASWNLEKSPLFNCNVRLKEDFEVKSTAIDDCFPPTINRKLFEKNDRFGHINKSLSSLNSAKSLQYGSKFFGLQKWYTDDFNVSQKMQTNVDRRKFRFGLKSNVDFLIQLDIENLIFHLTTKAEKSSENCIPKQKINTVSDGSFTDLMQKSNGVRLGSIEKILKRLRSNTNFTQSLSQYFAMDDMIEPVACVINEALRKGPDLGVSLRGGTVASCAQVYRHMASTYDHDKSETVGRGNAFRKGPYSGSKQNSRLNSGSMRARSGINSGFCFEFQERGRCARIYCYYKHKCETCKSTSHGSSKCSKTRS